MEEEIPQPEEVGKKEKQGDNKDKDSFMFPLSVQKGMTFQSLESLLEAIAKDSTPLKSLCGLNVYTRHCRPSKANCKRIHFSCNFCSANINCRALGEGKVYIKLIDHNHFHTIERFADPVEEEIYRMYRSEKDVRQTNRQMSQLLMREYSLTQTTCSKLINRFKKFETNNFQYLDGWLKENRYEYRVQWGIEPRNRLPRIIIMASPGMRENYTRYGDLVAFDITYGLLRNVTSDSRRYKVGVFTVFDTNLRILIAGIAILVEETKEAMFTVLDQFIQLHGKSPGSFISDDQKTFALAVNELRDNEFFAGSHMLDPWHLLKAIKPKINGDEASKRIKLSEIFSLMIQRNVVDYNASLLKLQNDPATREAMKILESRKERIFYCEVDSSFIGIRRTSCQPINEIIKRQIPVEVTIDRFLLQVDAIDNRLRDRSANAFELMKEPVEKFMCDDRIQEIRQNYERNVVQRFLENYIKGLREWKLTSKGLDKGTGKPTFTASFIEGDCQYSIRNWNCSCNEIEKTGIACPHLLLAASSTADKSYADLIAHRWKKEKIERQRPNPRTWLRKGAPMSSRRNTIKRSRKIGAR